MDIFLSVVVPVYNVERYLRKCIGSILHQTIDGMEIIIVDDGSVDSCPQICDEYAEKDNRIHVIHQKNKGLVNARKTGSLLAAGKYITFVDSDDWIEPDMYKTMKKLAEEKDTDILITGYFYDINGKSIQYKNRVEAGFYSGQSLEKLYSRMIYSGEFFYCGVFPSVWNKWYKKEILIPNLITIDERITMGEDMACTYPCMIDAKSIRIYDRKSFYHYCFHTQSLTNNAHTNYFRSFSILYPYLERCFREKGRTDLLKQVQYHKIFTSIAGIEQAIGKPSSICNGKWKKNLEFCWENTDIINNLKVVNMDLLEIPFLHKRIYKAFVQKRTWMLYFLIHILKLYRKVFSNKL